MQQRSCGEPLQHGRRCRCSRIQEATGRDPSHPGFPRTCTGAVPGTARRPGPRCAVPTGSPSAPGAPVFRPGPRCAVPAARGSSHRICFGLCFCRSLQSCVPFFSSGSDQCAASAGSAPPALAPRLQSCSEFWAPARLLPPGLEFLAKVLSLSEQSASWSALHFPLVKVSGLISLPIFSVLRV
jgi:hypothetical protein